VGRFRAARVRRYGICTAIGSAAGDLRAACAGATDNCATNATRSAASAAFAGPRGAAIAASATDAAAPATCAGPPGATGAAAAARAARARAAGAAGAACAARRRIGGDAFAGAVASRTESAGRSNRRSVAGACAVAGQATRIAACGAFVLWVAARGVGRALASQPGLVARNTDAIALVLATHAIHAERRSADCCAGTRRAVLALAHTAAIAGLSTGAATGNFGARGHGRAGTFVAVRRAGLASAGTGRGPAAHAIHAETRSASRSCGGSTPLAIAEIGDFVLPGLAGRHDSVNRSAEHHHHPALAIERRGRPHGELVCARGEVAQVPGWAFGTNLPYDAGRERIRRFLDHGHNRPSPEAVIDHISVAGVGVEMKDVATVALRPAGRNWIPLPKRDIVAGTRPRVEDENLLASIVEGQQRFERGIPRRREAERDRCTVGPGQLAAVPFPDGVVQGVRRSRGSWCRVGGDRGEQVAAEEQHLGAARVGDHGVVLARLGTRRGLKLAPLARAGVPFPGVTQHQLFHDPDG
jgi:hypothetical protein